MRNIWSQPLHCRWLANLYSDRTGIAWYVFYERLDQRYFFICSFPGSGIDRRITDPQKASETGQIFSAIGIAALYLSTMINTHFLHNFGMLPAAAIIAVITVGTVLLSRKRDSLIHRMLGIAACWLCAYPLFGSSLLSEPEGLLVLAFDSVTECTEHLCAGKKISYGFAVDTTCQHYDPFPGNGILCDQYTGNAGLGDSSCVWNLFPDRTSDPGSAEQLHTKRKTGGPCSE